MCNLLVLAHLLGARAVSNGRVFRLSQPASFVGDAPGRACRTDDRARAGSPGPDGPGVSLKPVISPTAYNPFGHRRDASSDSPVSSMLFKPERISGQPFDTALINFESGRSIS